MLREEMNRPFVSDREYHDDDDESDVHSVLADILTEYL